VNAETKRLIEASEGIAPWKKSGRNLSDRQWGPNTLSMKKAIDATMKKMENPGGSSN
jgi:hypothetical protein